MSRLLKSDICNTPLHDLHTRVWEVPATRTVTFVLDGVKRSLILCFFCYGVLAQKEKEDVEGYLRYLLGNMSYKPVDEDLGKLPSGVY